MLETYNIKVKNFIRVNGVNAAVVAARVAAQQRVRQRALACAGGADQHHAGGGVLRGGGHGQVQHSQHAGEQYLLHDICWSMAHTQFTIQCLSTIFILKEEDNTRANDTYLIDNVKMYTIQCLTCSYFS